VKPRVVADSVETVNGSVSVGADAQVLESAETVNGRITLDKRAQVGGYLETVNGDLLLDEAQVDGQLRTVNGDITVGAASRVGGGILVEESKGWKSGRTSGCPSRDRPGAVVDGTLRFEREVKLYVSNTATIGKVEGRHTHTVRRRPALTRSWQNPPHGPLLKPRGGGSSLLHRLHRRRATPIHGRCQSNTVTGRRRRGKPAPRG
jgi:hypothetical protein